MKLFWLLIIGGVSVSGVSFNQSDTCINDENGWFVPNLNGSFTWIETQQFDSYLNEMEKTASNNKLGYGAVTFYLYTKENPNKGKKVKATTQSIHASNFDSAHPTRFVIHGWNQGRHNIIYDINKTIRNAWLSIGKYNIVFVEWKAARLDYINAVVAVPKIGRKVAYMIDYLVKEHNMTLATLNVIGHSLGAHVAGYAGKNVKSGKIHTIVGLDAASPGYHYNKPKTRLAATDAFYVESIHTNAELLGFLKPIGKADFYPHGGRSQPGCGLDVFDICSHERSVTYYAESVTANSFASIQCETYENAIDKKCGSTYSSVRMGGAQNSYMAAGYFYVPVNRKSPFGMSS